MERLVASSTTLLVVDVQEKLAAAMPPSMVDEVVKNAGILLETADALGMRVLASEQYPKGLGPTVAGVATKLAAMSVTPMPKMAFDACSELTLSRALADSGAKSVVVVGMEAHVCVFQTALDLLVSGMGVWIVADAVSSRTPQNKAIALQRLTAEGVKLSSTEMALFEMLAVSGTNEFREISKIIK